MSHLNHKRYIAYGTTKEKIHMVNPNHISSCPVVIRIQNVNVPLCFSAARGIMKLNIWLSSVVISWFSSSVQIKLCFIGVLQIQSIVEVCPSHVITQIRCNGSPTVPGKKKHNAETVPCHSTATFGVQAWGNIMNIPAMTLVLEQYNKDHHGITYVRFVE